MCWLELQAPIITLSTSMEKFEFKDMDRSRFCRKTSSQHECSGSTNIQSIWTCTVINNCSEEFHPHPSVCEYIFVLSLSQYPIFNQNPRNINQSKVKPPKTPCKCLEVMPSFLRQPLPPPCAPLLPVLVSCQVPDILQPCPILLNSIPFWE